ACDPAQHAVELVEHGARGNTNGANSLREEEFVALRVPRHPLGIVMARAVDLHRQRRRRTEEVEGVGLYGVLAAELEPAKALVSQGLPQSCFRRAHAATQVAGPVDGALRAPLVEVGAPSQNLEHGLAISSDLR